MFSVRRLSWTKTHSDEKKGHSTRILGIILLFIALLIMVFLGGCAEQTQAQKTALKYVEEIVRTAESGDMVIASSPNHDLVFLFIVHREYDGAYITGNTPIYGSTAHKATIGDFYTVMTIGNGIGKISIIRAEKVKLALSDGIRGMTYYTDNN